MSIITGIISGFIANGLFTRNEKSKRLNRIKKELGKYTGLYDVYHWRDLIKPDSCGYQVSISLIEKEGVLRVHQTGKNDYDELVADIKMDELSLSYGEGNYIHPKKEKNPYGRMKIFLVDELTINVDKNYLDMKDESSFIPYAEKWQWKKKNSFLRPPVESKLPF